MELFSFIEASITGDATKTGNTAKKSRVSFPVTGLALGVSGQPWAKKWLEQRFFSKLNADEDGCLMREPFADGVFGKARMLPVQAFQWL